MRIISILKELLSVQQDSFLIDKNTYTWAQEFNNYAGSIKDDEKVGLLLTPSGWNLDIDSHNAIENGKFDIYYLTTQPKLCFNADTNETKINSMIDIAVDMVARIRADKRLTIITTNIESQSIYDANNRNLTGCCLKLHLTENQGRCISLQDVFVPKVYKGEVLDITNQGFMIADNKVEYDAQTQVVSEVGVMYGTDGALLDKKSVGVLEGNKFTVVLSGLDESTTYTCKPYAIVNNKVYESGLVMVTTRGGGLEQPLLYASEPSEITMDSALLNGVIVLEGFEVEEYGVVWADHDYPTIEDNVCSVELDEDEYSYLLDGLQSDTVYFYRSYCVLASGSIYYSTQESFSTALPRPVVETFDGTDILPNKFTANGLVYDNNYSVDESGFVYGKNPEPTVDDTKVIPTFVNYNYHHDLDGLDSGDLYHYRSFAKCGDLYIYGGDKEVQLWNLPYQPIEYCILPKTAYIYPINMQKEGMVIKINRWRMTASGNIGLVMGNGYVTGTTQFATRDNNRHLEAYIGGTHVYNQRRDILSDPHSFEIAFMRDYYIKYDAETVYTGQVNKDMADNQPFYFNAVYNDEAAVSKPTQPTEWGKMTFSTDDEVFMILQPCELIENITAEQSWDSQPHNAGEVGFWDTIGNIFYGNAGSGTITKP